MFVICFQMVLSFYSCSYWFDVFVLVLFLFFVFQHVYFQFPTYTPKQTNQFQTVPTCSKHISTFETNFYVCRKPNMFKKANKQIPKCHHHVIAISQHIHPNIAGYIYIYICVCLSYT